MGQDRLQYEQRRAPSTSHGTKNTKLRSSVRTSISAPAKPPTTLVARSNPSHRRRTPPGQPAAGAPHGGRVNGEQGERTRGVGGDRLEDQSQQRERQQPTPAG
jgi:hypothetical protein